MKNSQYDEFILKNAHEKNIDPNWIKAIITQESAWNPCAMRYEISYRYLYKPETFKVTTVQTEFISQRISWGLGQIMGAVAREQGHTGFLSELVIPEINLHHMTLLIQSLMRLSQQKDDVFAMYNGGEVALKKVNHLYPNQSYVDSVNRHLSHLTQTGVP